jgi:hypothetical protein
MELQNAKYGGGGGEDDVVKDDIKFTFIYLPFNIHSQLCVILLYLVYLLIYYIQ